MEFGRVKLENGVVKIVGMDMEKNGRERRFEGENLREIRG